ncbi:MAG: hypothetical protein LIP23_01510 [Planctomycetes bacterium]|nr:hypothetical protein [Planctomycetota bacterium]
MKRLSFLVNRGENDCFMVHGLDWATYAEADDWTEITRIIFEQVSSAFHHEERPDYLDFMFPDGTVVSLCA